SLQENRLVGTCPCRKSREPTPGEDKLRHYHERQKFNPAPDIHAKRPGSSRSLASPYPCGFMRRLVPECRPHDQQPVGNSLVRMGLPLELDRYVPVVVDLTQYGRHLCVIDVRA